ncbi:MAG: glycosyltransferase family 4 protein [Bacteroidota bacterium]
MDRVAGKGVRLILEQCIAPRNQYIEAMQRLEEKLVSSEVRIDLSGLRRSMSYARIAAGIEGQEWILADKIFCPSQFVAASLAEMGVPKAKIRVIPYGVTVSNDRVPHQREILRNKPRIIFGGSFSWRKGAYEFGLLSKKIGKCATFEAYGGVAVEQNIINEIAPNVIFKGRQPKQIFLENLAQSDILVLPSYSEGSATVVYEAMAHGLACVVTNECGSVITDGIDGLIVSASDDEGLYRSVRRLVDDKDFRMEICRNAQSTARQHTREAYGQRVLEQMMSIDRRKL